MFERRDTEITFALRIAPTGSTSRARSSKLTINRDKLVERLAEVSHLTYVRQKSRDQGVPLAELTLNVTDHDRERAEDIVAELERLGVFQGLAPDWGSAEGDAPEPAAPPPPKTKGQPLTDIWGYPTSGRSGRRR